MRFENILTSSFIGYNLFSLYLCLIEADSIIEWRDAKKYKTKVRIMISLRDGLIIWACRCKISFMDSS